MANLEKSLTEIFPTKRPLVMSILATLQQEWGARDVVFAKNRSARPYTYIPPMPRHLERDPGQ